MSSKKQSSRQYLINIQKHRSVISLVACTVTLICSLAALGAELVLYGINDWKISYFFAYFTTISNILTALAGSFIMPYAITGIRRKRFVLPKWLSMFHYSGVICITLVFIFMLFIILPYDKDFALGGPNFFLHVICPIAIIVSYFMVESHYDYSKKEVLKCMIPFFIYSIVYVVMVSIGPENGGWKDLYKLNTYVSFAVSVPVGYISVFVIALLIKKLADLLYIKRENELISSWRKDADPVEVKIEVYGLGRYYGLHGDKNSLSVPFDILESLSKHYNIEVADLYSAYAKGLYHGIGEREA